MISSIVPHSPSMITTSSSLIGWVSAIWIPAMMFPSTGLAAKPSTMPATPAEASSEVPIRSTRSYCMSATPAPKIPITTIRVRLITATCVCIRRALRLSATSIRCRARIMSSAPRTTPMMSQVIPSASSAAKVEDTRSEASGVASPSPLARPSPVATPMSSAITCAGLRVCATSFAVGVRPSSRVTRFSTA